MPDPTPDLTLVPTESERQPGGAAATAPPGPYCEAEFGSFIASVWNFPADDAEEDLTRFDELLHAALVFIAGIALDPSTDPHEADRAATVLRSMEQRALWGPGIPVVQP